jgi:hypothetical protein
MPFLEQSTIYNAMNFSYTQEWVYSGTVTGPSFTEVTVFRASISTLLCPSDAIINTGSGDSSIVYQCGNFNYRQLE